MTADDHADLVREAIARLRDVDGTAERSRIVGVSYSTMSRWVRAVEAGEDPPVPLLPQTLGPLLAFVEGDGHESPATVAARWREMARTLRAEAEKCERWAAEAEAERDNPNGGGP